MKKISDKIHVFESLEPLMPGVTFPLRSTSLRLSSDTAAIFSPGPFQPEDVQFLRDHSKTVIAIAPNAFHHRHLKKFKEHFPDAAIFGPPTLIKKQPWLESELQSFDHLPEEFTRQVSPITIRGNTTLDETVFYDQDSQTLILTDLIFNMRAPMPLGRSLILRMVGARDKIAQSKLVLKTIADSGAYQQSIEKILSLEMKRVIVGHGDILDTKDDIEQMKRVLAS